MITKMDLQEAIAECEGKKKPDASTCLKLAAFYTIKDKMYPNENKSEYEPSKTYQGAYYDSGEDETEKTITYSSGSEFSKLINGRNAYEIWAVMDELMDALTAINPRLYNSVIRKIK
jgi:hypothetical protein